MAAKENKDNCSFGAKWLRKRSTDLVLQKETIQAREHDEIDKVLCLPRSLRHTQIIQSPHAKDSYPAFTEVRIGNAWRKKGLEASVRFLLMWNNVSFLPPMLKGVIKRDFVQCDWVIMMSCAL